MLLYSLEYYQEIVCLGIDGKEDKKTLICKDVELNGETVLKKCIESEHHLTFTNVIGYKDGQYLTHRTLSENEQTGEVLA